MNIIVNKLLVNYEITGSGPVILLLHGWGDSLATFDSLLHGLTADHTVVRLDLPGFGKTQPPVTAWSLDTYVDFVTSFVAKLDLDIDVVIGHSNGGAIAIKAISAKKLSPRKLVLIASAGIRIKSGIKNRLLRTTTKLGKSAAKPLPKVAQAKLQKFLYKKIGSDYLVAPHMKETFKKIVGEDIQLQASTLDVPTLIINGSEDDATPLIYAEKFHKLIENSQLEIIDGAGHFVHQQESNKTVRLISEFIK